MQDVIASGQFTMGEKVQSFEERFARFIGSEYCVMVNSGSSANLLAIAALKYRKKAPLRAGDEIIVPSVSWSTTYYPVHQYGMRLVFVDIDLDTLNLDASGLEAALSDRTRAILVPNLLGNPAALDVLADFCERHDLELIEDNCESMGAALGGRQAGTFGRLGTFSCFYSHHISTMEGGLVVTDDRELYHILLSLRAHGWTRQLPKNNEVCKKSSDTFRESFRFVLPGYNVRPMELSGALGIEQLKKLPRIIRERRSNATRFQKHFQDDGRFRLQRENGRSSWFGFSLVMEPAWRVSRKKVLETLCANGIEVRPIVSGNFLVNEVLGHMEHRIVGAHGAAQAVHDRGFFVGNHPRPFIQELNLLKEVLEQVGRRSQKGERESRS